MLSACQHVSANIRDSSVLLRPLPRWECLEAGNVQRTRWRGLLPIRLNVLVLWFCVPKVLDAADHGPPSVGACVRHFVSVLLKGDRLWTGNTEVRAHDGRHLQLALVNYANAAEPCRSNISVGYDAHVSIRNRQWDTPHQLQMPHTAELRTR